MLTFRPVHGGDEGELWASAKLDEDMHDGRAGRGGRPGKRTGSPIPEGTALSVCDVAACGQGGGRRGGGEAHSFAAPSSNALGAARALALGAPISLNGILRIGDYDLASFLEFFVSVRRIRRREAAAQSPPEVLHRPGGVPVLA